MAPRWSAAGARRARGRWSMGCTHRDAHRRAALEPLAAARWAIFKIASTRESPAAPEDVGVSADARSFVDARTRRDPTMRPTAEALLTHPFVTGRARGGGGRGGRARASVRGVLERRRRRRRRGGDGGERGTLGSLRSRARGGVRGASAGGRVPPSREASARTVGSAPSVRYRETARGTTPTRTRARGRRIGGSMRGAQRRFENLDDGEDDEEARRGMSASVERTRGTVASRIEPSWVNVV